MKKRLKIIILLTAITSLVSCGTVNTGAKLKLPPSIAYPVISPGEASCLTDSTFKKIKDRDKLKSARIETLRNIIKSTH